VALKYKGGVMVAADTLASYGSLARFEGVTRIAKVGISKDTLLAAGGDYSDYQMILKMVEQKAVADFAADDGSSLSPKAMHHWLTRVMYNRRSKMDPLWNSVIITGFRDGKAYLGSSDLYGTMFEDDFVATGLGGHLALPLIRKAWHAEMSEEEARKLLVDCMRVLFYRDTRASASIQVGTVSAEGSNVGEPFKLDTFWECAAAPPPSRAPSPAAAAAPPAPGALPHPLPRHTLMRVRTCSARHPEFLRGGGHLGDGSW
jgi:20S proteasome subunit beta 7